MAHSCDVCDTINEWDITPSYVRHNKSDMTESYVWHNMWMRPESVMCVTQCMNETWFHHMCDKIYERDMTQSYVRRDISMRHDSIIRDMNETWLCEWDMTPSYEIWMRHDYVNETWLHHMCDIWMRRDSFILRHDSITHAEWDIWMRRDSIIRDMNETWLCDWDMTPSYG